MSETETLPQVVESKPLSAAQIRAQVNLIQNVMTAVMRKGEHYGIIPGCQKPSLWKPGAEKLLMTFRIASEPVIEDLSTSDEVRYRVIRRGVTAHGTFVGSGIGECSSSEEKYRWRKAVCDEEFNATPEDRKRLKWGKSDGKTYTVKQIRTNPADVANTVLKMADKRAYVGLSLNVTAASDIFTQGVEDLPEGMEHDEPKTEPIKGPEAQAKPAAAKPAEKPKPAPAELSDDVVTFVPAAVSVKTGEGAKGPWTKYGIKSPDNEWYGTFDTKMGELAQEAKAGKFPIRIQFAVDGKYKSAVTVERVEEYVAGQE